jgi:hypothetical protein
VAGDDDHAADAVLDRLQRGLAGSGHHGQDLAGVVHEDLAAGAVAVHGGLAAVRGLDLDSAVRAVKFQPRLRTVADIARTSTL